MTHEEENESQEIKIRHDNIKEEFIGLKYCKERKTIDIGVKSGQEWIEISLKIEEAKDLLEGLKEMIMDAQADKDKIYKNTDPENSEDINILD